MLPIHLNSFHALRVKHQQSHKSLEAFLKFFISLPHCINHREVFCAPSRQYSRVNKSLRKKKKGSSRLLKNCSEKRSNDTLVRRVFLHFLSDTSRGWNRYRVSQVFLGIGIAAEKCAEVSGVRYHENDPIPNPWIPLKFSSCLLYWLFII